MNKIFLYTLILSFGIVNAQLPVNDSVSLGANYTKMSFYSFASGETANVNAKDWDLQIGTSLMDAAIRVNDNANVLLFNLATSDTANWNAVDTTGMMALYNSDTSWSMGAFNVLGSGQFDYGWGVYDIISHNVAGNRIFVLLTINGNYKKVWVKSLVGGDEYTIRIANLDSSGDTTITLKKSDYPGKTSFYYAIDAGEVKNIEPAQTQWDIVFRRYSTWLSPPGFYYTVSGALLNPDVTAAEARGVPTTEDNYGAYTFESNISVIGYDWKEQSLAIVDSLLYFVGAQDGNIYKLVFTKFGGMANGNINFSKTNLTPSTTSANEISNIGALAVYPNPTAANIQALFTLDRASAVTLNILDLSGKSHFSVRTYASAGLNNLTLNTADLAQGFYLLSVDDGNNKLIYKLVKN